MLPSVFPASLRDSAGEVAVYFEAAAVIVTLVLLGQVVELRARTRTGAAIKALLGLTPKTARGRLDGANEPLCVSVQVGALRRELHGLHTSAREDLPIDGEAETFCSLNETQDLHVRVGNFR